MNYSLGSPLGRESLEVRIILLLYFTENPLLSTIMLFVSNHHVFIQEQRTLTLRGLHCQHQNFLTISGYNGWRSLHPSYELISCRSFRAPITVPCSNNGKKKARFGRGGEKINRWMFQTLCRKSVLLEYPKICFILLLNGVVSVCTTILPLLTTVTTCKLLFAVNLVHSVSYVTFKKE